MILLCTDCGDFNYAKRFQTADVKGQIDYNRF
jgi:ribosomal protein L33